MPTPSYKPDRLFLSPPFAGEREMEFVADALASNWIAPLGPHVDAFEAEICAVTGSPNAVALSSGTSALHLALILAGVERDDDVIVSDLTFVASVNPIAYIGARPVLVDSEFESWNMDPELLTETLTRRARLGRLPKAVVVVHLYGQSANLDAIRNACDTFEVPLIEDAAEALGATHYGRSPGTIGAFGALSFNGNKMITTSGGGMLLAKNSDDAARARKLATQARDAAPHYEHSEIGFNYRLSNVLAAIGRAQLLTLQQRVAARRRAFAFYQEHLGVIPGISFMPEARWGVHARWLSTLTIDPEVCASDRETVRLALEAVNIESRPVWKPMHLQPLYASADAVGGSVAAHLFRDGLCLPSGSNLSDSDLSRIVESVIRAVRR